MGSLVRPCLGRDGEGLARFLPPPPAGAPSPAQALEALAQAAEAAARAANLPSPRVVLASLLGSAGARRSGDK